MIWAIRPLSRERRSPVVATPSVAPAPLVGCGGLLGVFLDHVPVLLLDAALTTLPKRKRTGRTFCTVAREHIPKLRVSAVAKLPIPQFVPLGVFERVRNDLRGERDKHYASVPEDRWAGLFIDPSPTIDVGAYNAALLLEGNFSLPPDILMLVPSVGAYELNEGTRHVETGAALALYVRLVLGSDLALQLAVAKVE